MDLCTALTRAEAAGNLLVKRNERVVVVESTTGGFVSGCLVACGGASRFFVSSTVVYGGKTFLPIEIVKASGVLNREENYLNKANYVESKRKYVDAVAKLVRKHFNKENLWVVVESGTCGPEFYIPGVDSGFTAIGISGPMGDSVRVIESKSRNRIENMRLFTEETLNTLHTELAKAPLNRSSL